MLLHGVASSKRNSLSPSILLSYQRPQVWESPNVGEDAQWHAGKLMELVLLHYHGLVDQVRVFFRVCVCVCVWRVCGSE
jgi:hypothetical protein